MTFLNKFGRVVGEIGKVVAGVAGIMPIVEKIDPAHAPVYQTVSKDLEQIGGIVLTLESVGSTLGLPGAQKLQATAPLIGQVVLQSSMLAGRKIKDPALFQRGCTKLGDGMADILNSVEDKIEVEDKIA